MLAIPLLRSKAVHLSVHRERCRRCCVREKCCMSEPCEIYRIPASLALIVESLAQHCVSPACEQSLSFCVCMPSCLWPAWREVMEQRENMDTVTAESAKKRGRTSCEWMQKHLEKRNELGLPATWSGWAGHTPQWLSARQQDLIQIAWGAQSPPRHASQYYCDVSQSVAHCPWSRGMRCLTTSSQVFSFELEGVISEIESLHLMGQPKELDWAQWKKGEKHSIVLRKAVGQSMTVPCIATCLLAYFLNPHGGWWMSSGMAESERLRIRVVGDNDW